MSKPKRTALYLLLFLALAEVALRGLESFGPEPSVDIDPASPTLVLALGTSRSHRNVSPAEIEVALVEAGVENPWAAVVHRSGATYVGLYRLYMEQIHPWAVENAVDGVVAVELRGSSLNDSYMLDAEAAFVAQSAPELDGPSRTLAAVTTDLDTAAQNLLWRVRLFRGKDEVRRSLGHWLRRRELSERAGSGSIALVDYLESFDWGSGSKGFKGFRRRAKELNVDLWRRRYEDELLRDYRIGGVQTSYLRLLVRQIRDDGLTPLMCVMPVTAEHRAFYAPGDYEGFLSQVRRLAEDEGVAFVDLDTGHELSRRAFRDTHHLHIDAARDFSRRLARAGVLPLVSGE